MRVLWMEQKKGSYGRYLHVPAPPLRFELIKVRHVKNCLVLV